MERGGVELGGVKLGGVERGDEAREGREIAEGG